MNQTHQVMSTKIKIIAVILVLALLPTGCLVGPKYSRPEQPKSEKYIQSQIAADTTASVTNVKWFDIFNDDVLKGLINKGIENNFDMQIALTRLEKVRAELGYSKADMLPNFGYGGLVNSNSKYILPSNARATMSWELDFWGKVRHENRALKAELLATDEARKVILMNIVSDIAITYFELRDLDNELEIALNTAKARNKSLEIIIQRFQGGYVSEVDKVQIEQQVAIAEAAIPNIKREITRTQNTLCFLTGQLPTTIERGKSIAELQVLSEIPINIPSALLENRPDVKATELNYMAANERIGVAQAMRFPSFNISAFTGFTSYTVSTLFDEMSSNLAGSVAGPIFNFGKNRRRVEIYRQLAEESKIRYKKAYFNAVSEVEQALMDINTFKDEYIARSKQVTAAKKNLELSNARYNDGYVSYLEVLEVERSLFEAQLSLSRLSQYQLTATVNLYKSLGGGWN